MSLGSGRGSKGWMQEYPPEGDGLLTTVLGAEEERWGLQQAPFLEDARVIDPPVSYTERVDPQYDGIFFQSGDGLLLYDVDGAILQANDTLSRMLRYGREELLTISIVDLYPIDSIELAHYMTDTLLEQGSLSLEVSFKRKNSQTFPAEVNASLCDYGNKKAILLSVRDITARKQMEEALRYLQQSIDQIVDAIYWVRETGQFEFVNEGAGNTLGFTKVELLAMKFQDIDLNFTEEGWEAHWNELKTRASFYSDSWHHTKRGHVLPVEMSWNYVEVYGRQLACVVSRDISQRKKREANIVLRQEEAELVGYARSHYSGQLNQEMKGPLEALLERVDELEHRVERRDYSDSSSLLREVRAQGHHLLQLVDQMELFSKNGEEGIALELSRVALEPLIEEVIEQVQANDGVQTMQISLDCPSDMIGILADGSKLKKAMVHLIRGLFGSRPEELLWIRVVVSDRELQPMKIELSQLFSSSFAESGHAIISFSGEYAFDLVTSETGNDLSLLIGRSLIDLMGYELEEVSHGDAGYTCTLVLNE